MMNLHAPHEHILPKHHPLIEQLYDRATTASNPAPDLEVAYVWARPGDPLGLSPSGAYVFTVPPLAGVAAEPAKRPWPSMIAVPEDDLLEIIEHTGVWLMGAIARGLHCYVAVVVR